MNRQHLSARVLLIVSLAIGAFAAPAWAQYSEPGPTGGGSCRPAYEEPGTHSTTPAFQWSWDLRFVRDLRFLPAVRSWRPVLGVARTNPAWRPRLTPLAGSLRRTSR